MHDAKDRDRAGQAFLAGGGEMGSLIRAYDWAASPLGPPEGWPQGLKTAVRLLLSTQHPMFIWWGPDLLQFYNDAYRRSIGPERHPSAIGQPGRECWAEIWDIIGPQIELVMAGDGSTWHENHLVPITRNGRREDVYWTYSYSPIDEPGSPTGVGGVLVVCAETTEAVLVQQRHGAQLARFETMFEQAPGFIAVLRGPDHVVEMANAAYRALTGDRQLLGRPVREAIPEVAGQGFLTLLDEVYASGRPFTARRRPVVLDSGPEGEPRQRYLDFVYQPVNEEDGTISGIFVEGYDVTDQTAAEEALRASEALLRDLNASLEQRVGAALAERKVLADLVENTDALIQVLDSKYRILAINRASADAFERLYGVRPKLGDKLLDHLADLPEQRAQLRAYWRRALAGEEFSFIDEFGAPDRQRRQHQVTFNALRDREGRQIAAYTFAYDVTERMREQAELEQTHEALRQSQKLESMGKLTGGVAHDFNNLLTPIIAGLDMLQRRGVGGEREQRLIDAALISAERAKTLVQRLLAFARRQPLQPTAVDVVGLIGGMADLVAATTGPQIRVVVDTPSGLPTARADPNQLEMAILNLSVNARDAMPDGGTLRISAVDETVDAADGGELPAGRYVRISVSDTGIGMDDITLAHSVEPFYSTKGVGKGTGLGLSMVHGLMSQLDGALDISSQPGLGTNVELWLPVGGVAPVSAKAPTRAGATQVGVALLVDDEDLVRMSTADMLVELGYKVVEATSAEEALKLMNAGVHADLVVTDHLMPGMNGADLARAIARGWPAIRVLIISGYAEVEGIAPDLPRLSKPFRQADLAASVARLNRDRDAMRPN